MGIYSDYLNKQMSFADLGAERKAQLRRISALRGGRDVLAFAADLGKGQAPISIGYADLLPINDQLANLEGTKLDLILETPGGSGEVAEDIVRLLRGRYTEIGVIVPGCAKSAGTIMAMAADEILMEPASSLGPIDAQIQWQGKIFSADALLKGFDKIKQEVAATNALNRAYIPMLQGISPGELQSAENALDFARVLVTDWLATYKFRTWTNHSSNGLPVTEEEKKERAREIAAELCDHGKWLTHGRSIKIADFDRMRLRITDYSTDRDLSDAIRRYYTLLQMTFATNIYKIIETTDSQIVRFINPSVTPAAETPKGADIAAIELQCPNCQSQLKIQANLGQTHPLQPGCLPFPPDNKIKCPKCGTELDLSDARRQLEAQAKKPVVS